MLLLKYRNFIPHKYFFIKFINYLFIYESPIIYSYICQETRILMIRKYSTINWVSFVLILIQPSWVSFCTSKTDHCVISTEKLRKKKIPLTFDKINRENITLVSI